MCDVAMGGVKSSGIVFLSRQNTLFVASKFISLGDLSKMIMIYLLSADFGLRVRGQKFDTSMCFTVSAMHDSTYLILPIIVASLFALLRLKKRGKKGKKKRKKIDALE